MSYVYFWTSRFGHIFKNINSKLSIEPNLKIAITEILQLYDKINLHKNKSHLTKKKGPDIGMDK